MIKRVYIEITNVCNLHCQFCSYTKREPEVMSLKFFEDILKQVKQYTDYIYLHVQGEPTLHPHFNDILSLCDQYNLKVQLVTNGTTLFKVKDILLSHPSIRKINFSLQSIEFHTLDLNAFQQTLFSFVDTCIQKKSPIVELRFWRSDELENDRTSSLLSTIKNTYSLTETNRNNNYSIAKNVYVDFDNMFEWPDELKEKNSTRGRCLGAIQQIAILSNGTVVPCCLDCNGEIDLGNLHDQSLDSIFQSHRYIQLVEGFKRNYLEESFCQKCTFRFRFNKS